MKPTRRCLICRRELSPFRNGHRRLCSVECQRRRATQLLNERRRKLREKGA